MDRCKTTEELLALEKSVCSFGDTIHYNDPVRIFTSCEGRYVIDDAGNKFLDFQMMYSAANFGYRNPHFEAALIDQVQTLPQLSSEFLSKEKILLSEKIADSCRERWAIDGRVHFNVGGAQAIDDSLKLVSANRGHRRVFAFEGGYHGRTIGASAITSSYRYRRGYGEFGSRAQFIPYPYCFRCPYEKDRKTCELYCVKQVERLFQSEYEAVLDTKSGESEMAAFYAEPVQGTGGYIVPPDGYFQELKKILDRYGILLVVDEIQMGLYRTGKLWAIEHFEVTPDILVFGKSLTNGLNPLSGLWASESLIAPEKFPPGSTHSTFSNNPLGMRLGCAMFDWLDERGYEHRVTEMGHYLRRGLEDLQLRHTELGDVGALGLAGRIEICHADGKTPNRALAQKIRQMALEISVDTDQGALRLILDIGGYFKNVFTLAPDLDIETSDIDRFLVIFENILIRAKGE